jgi:hypothetical protein
VRQLAGGAAESEIVGFQICLDRALAPTCTWDLWTAADRITGWCSGDGFFYFRLWPVGLGRDLFERLVRDPDALAEVPEVTRLAGRDREDWDDEEWLAWEELRTGEAPTSPSQCAVPRRPMTCRTADAASVAMPVGRNAVSAHGRPFDTQTLRAPTPVAPRMSACAESPMTQDE